MSITSTYIRNGKYDPMLYLEKFDYSLYKNIDKEDVEGLVEHKDMHNILDFISILNLFELSVSPTDLYPTNKLKYYYNLNQKDLQMVLGLLYLLLNIKRKI